MRKVIYSLIAFCFVLAFLAIGLEKNQLDLIPLYFEQMSNAIIG